jgi:hypothetical protein
MTFSQLQFNSALAIGRTALSSTDFRLQGMCMHVLTQNCVTGLIVFGNGNDFTAEYNDDANFNRSLNGILSLQRNNQTLTMFFAESCMFEIYVKP